MRRRPITLATWSLVVFASSGSSATQQPTFRAGTAAVSVNVSVKRGNNAVPNLTAADFAVTDNGVPQPIEAVSIESVPVDVTLFLDTSGSLGARQETLKQDIAAILRMLRPEDRFRLLTIGDSVIETVPWVAAGTPVDFSFGVVGGRSLIHDAIAAALVYRAPATRRHLIVAATDREDVGSIVPAGLVLEMAKRADSALHIIDQQSSSGPINYRLRTPLVMHRNDSPGRLEQAANATGGQLHDRLIGSAPLLRSFTKIFDGFRQSYVLRYTPQGVPPDGWHTLGVTTPKLKGVNIRARQGYWAQ